MERRMEADEEEQAREKEGDAGKEEDTWPECRFFRRGR